MSAPTVQQAGRHDRSRDPALPVNVPEAELVDLRRRIAATRWPSQELVADRSQGVQLATIQELAALLGDGARLARLRGEAERATAVQDRDRRGRTSTSSTSSRRTRTRCR